VQSKQRARKNKANFHDLSDGSHVCLDLGRS